MIYAQESLVDEIEENYEYRSYVFQRQELLGDATGVIRTIGRRVPFHTGCCCQ